MAGMGHESTEEDADDDGAVSEVDPADASQQQALPAEEGRDAAPAAVPAPRGLRSTLATALSGVPFARAIVGGRAVTTSAGAATRGKHRFDSAVRLGGHSGPVTTVDVWQRPEEARRDWLGRNVPSRTANADAPRQLPSSSNYIIASGGADGTVRTWAARWRVDRRGRASGRALHLATHANLHRAGTVVEHVCLSVDGRICVSAGRDGSVGVVDVATSKTWQMRMPSRGGGLFSRPAADAWPTDASTPTGLPLTRCSVDVLHRPVLIMSAGVDGTVRRVPRRPARLLRVVHLLHAAPPCRSACGTFARGRWPLPLPRDSPSGALTPFARRTVQSTAMPQSASGVAASSSRGTRTASCGAGTRGALSCPYPAGRATEAPPSHRCARSVTRLSRGVPREGCGCGTRTRACRSCARATRGRSQRRLWQTTTCSRRHGMEGCRAGFL